MCTASKITSKVAEALLGYLETVEEQLFLNVLMSLNVLEGLIEIVFVSLLRKVLNNVKWVLVVNHFIIFLTTFLFSPLINL